MEQIVLENKLIPVVVFNSLDEVHPILDKLRDGGIKLIEICFRTPCSLEGLKMAIKHYPDLFIGAGTIINTRQANEALNAGAKFLVSPGFNEEIARMCINRDVTYIPGVVTPTEIMYALELGINYLKFFPAGVYGGLKAMDALSSAFPQVKFMPTGGVSLDNLGEYVKKKYIFAIGGSFLLKGDVVENCKKAIAILKENK